MKNISTHYKKYISTLFILVVVIAGTKVFAGVGDGTFDKVFSASDSVAIPLHTGTPSQLKGAGATSGGITVQGFTSKGVSAFNQQTFFNKSILGKNGILRIGGVDTGGTTRTVEASISGKLLSAGTLLATDLASPTAPAITLTNLCADADGKVVPCTGIVTTNTATTVSSGLDLCDNITGVQDESVVHMGSAGAVYQDGYYVLDTTGNCVPDFKIAMDPSGSFVIQTSMTTAKQFTYTIFYQTAIDYGVGDADAAGGGEPTGKVSSNNSLSGSITSGTKGRTGSIPVTGDLVEFCVRSALSQRYTAPQRFANFQSLQTTYGAGKLKSSSIDGKCN